VPSPPFSWILTSAAHSPHCFLKSSLSHAAVLQACCGGDGGDGGGDGAGGGEGEGEAEGEAGPSKETAIRGWSEG